MAREGQAGAAWCRRYLGRDLEAAEAGQLVGLDLAAHGALEVRGVVGSDLEGDQRADVAEHGGAHALGQLALVLVQTGEGKTAVARLREHLIEARGVGHVLELIDVQIEVWVGKTGDC